MADFNYRGMVFGGFGGHIYIVDLNKNSKMNTRTPTTLFVRVGNTHFARIR